MTTNNNRHTDQRLRSMEVAAAAFVAFVFLLGGACGFAIRGAL